MNARLFTLLTALAMAGQTNAAIIYESFGPEPSSEVITPSHIVEWTHFGYGRSVATPFSFTDSAYQLASITLNVHLATPDSASNLEIGIYSNSGGFPSLTPVASLFPNPTSITAQRQLLTYSFSGQEVLSPNTPYWLVLQPRIFDTTSSDSDVVYAFSSATNLPNAGFAVRTILGSDQEWGAWTAYNGPSPIFRLDGTAVPEPGTWALLGLGGALLWAATRRRRK